MKKGIKMNFDLNLTIMKAETILQEKSEKYFCYFDENQKKMILEAMECYANPFIEKHQSEDIKAGKIINIIQEYYSLDENYSITRSRNEDVRFARQVAMYFIREFTKLSTSKIGKKFDRDHTTVLSANNRIKDQLWYDKNFEIEIQNLKRFIHEKIN